MLLPKLQLKVGACSLAPTSKLLMGQEPLTGLEMGGGGKIRELEACSCSTIGQQVRKTPTF